MLATRPGVVSRSAQDSVGHTSEPTVNIDDILKPSIKGGSRISKMLIVGDDWRKIVGFPVVLVEKEPAIKFWIVTSIRDARSGHTVRLWTLETVAVLTCRIINEFILVELPITTIVKLRIKEDVTVASHLQESAAGQR